MSTGALHQTKYDFDWTNDKFIYKFFFFISVGYVVG
jgi:hypothetical protein